MRGSRRRSFDTDHYTPHIDLVISFVLVMFSWSGMAGGGMCLVPRMADVESRGDNPEQQGCCGSRKFGCCDKEPVSGI